MDASLESLGESAERRRLLELMLQRKGIGVRSSRIPKRSARGLCALSHAQQRLWFIDQLDPQGGAAYHIAGALRLLGTLDRAALREALDAIVRRHEVLRTRFVVVDGTAMQTVSESARFSLHEHDLSVLEPVDRDDEIRRAAEEEACGRFDLAAGPVIRGRLIRCAEDEHVLLLTMHHIVADGWSMGILIDELSAYYAAFREGRPDPLPPLPIQYADYAVWQREWLQGELLEHQLGFWKEHLNGAPALLELPTDRPRPVSQSYRGGSVRIALSAELAGELNALARKHGTTLFVVLHTGLAILLSGLSGQKDVVIGVPVANRRRTEIEPLIGIFVNTLALRTRFDVDTTVSAALEQVKATALAGYDNQDVPFEKVVEAVNPPRTLSRSPVFQVMLVLQNVPRGTLELPGIAFAPLTPWSSTEKFDLTVSVHETNSGISGTVGYASDLFDRSTIERWVGCFETVLAAMAESAARPLGEICLLSETERARVTAEFNATRIEHPEPALVHEIFERQARCTPDAVAAIHEGRVLTYRQLNRQANRLARQLRARGAKPDRPVAICLERGLDAAVAVLAVLKAGSPYLPLDPSYPSARLQYMLDDASPHLVLAQRATLQALAKSAATVVLLDDGDRQGVTEEDDSDQRADEIGLSPEHLCYVIYTSGSTGRPKGVGLPHRALSNLLHWHLSAFPVPTCVLQFAPLSFDVSFNELFAAWGCGGAAAIPSEEIRYDAAALARFMHAHRVDKAIVPVTVLQEMADLHQESADRLTHLRHVIATGEQLKITPAVRRLFERLPQCALHNHYGPSETHVVTAFTLEGPPADWPDHPPIGRPIANTRIYILDAHGQPVPIGVVGELFIAGAGVGREYLNRPDLTAERFVPDPFGAAPSSRMYRTGDLARWRADGSIECLGRNDHQVKIRGFRIELAEIEGCLSRHEGIREAVVLACESVPGEKRLVAYFTSNADGVGGEELRAHLRASLPEHMVPSAYVRLDSIPLTPNGKVDRESLKREAVADSEARRHEPPVGELEQALAAIWQELLDVERVSRHDSFFDLGGHSMLTGKLIRRLQQVGLTVSLATVFKHPTLHGLAQCLEMGLDQDLVPNPILLREGGGAPLFLVHEVSGDVLPYLPLAKLLPEDVSVWGLQSLGIWHLHSLEQLAAEHVEAVRRVQPHGPYRLAGWSLGALIAYEMAYQLVGTDETVEFLGLIDAIAPVGTSLPAMEDCEVLNQFIRDRFSRVGPDVVRELTALGDIERFLETCKAKKYLPNQLTVEDVRRLIRNRRLIPEMTRRYSPVTLPLTVHCFDAEEPLPAPFSRNWEALVGDRVSHHAIGGTHRTIMQAPHLQRVAAAMSEALESAGAERQPVSEYAPLQPIQLTVSARATIFCVPGAGASIACFLQLAHALGGDVDVYGLQPRGLQRGEVPHSSVTAAAKPYLDAIRKACPAGPYRLLGHSFGGWAAFETARMLREQGEEVATVVVLDSEAPSAAQRHYTRTELLVKLIDAIEQGSGRRLGLTADDFQHLHNTVQVQLLRDRMVSAGILHRDVPVDAVQRTMHVFARNLRTVYLPAAPLDADVALFQATWPADADRRREMAADAAAWSKLARSLVVLEAPGNHMTMLRAPHVESMAREIVRIWTSA